MEVEKNTFEKKGFCETAFESRQRLKRQISHLEGRQYVLKNLAAEHKRKHEEIIKNCKLIDIEINRLRVENSLGEEPE